MTATELAWATGLFEGEGCIHLRKDYRSVKLEMNQTDYDVLLRLQNYFGGKIYDMPKKENRKQMWKWLVARKALVIPLLEAMLPMLGERRAYKALNALDHLECTP